MPEWVADKPRWRRIGWKPEGLGTRPRIRGGKVGENRIRMKWSGEERRERARAGWRNEKKRKEIRGKLGNWVQEAVNMREQRVQ